MENRFRYIELEDMIGRPPKIYTRLGGIGLLVILGLILLLSSFIVIPSTNQVDVVISLKNPGEFIIKSKGDHVVSVTNKMYLNKGDTLALVKRENKISAISCPYNCTVYKTVREESDTLAYFLPTDQQYYLKTKVDIKKIKEYLGKNSFHIEITKNMVAKADSVSFSPILGSSDILIEGVFTDAVSKNIKKEFPLVQKLNGNLILERKKTSILSTILGIDV